LKDNWGGERNILREFANDLRGRENSAFVGGKLGERLRELGVTVLLVRIGRSQEMFRGGEFGGELGAVAAVGAPGLHQCEAKNRCNDKRRDLDVMTDLHEPANHNH